MAFVRRRVEGLTTATPVTIGTVGGGNAGVGPSRQYAALRCIEARNFSSSAKSAAGADVLGRIEIDDADGRILFLDAADRDYATALVRLIVVRDVTATGLTNYGTVVDATGAAVTLAAESEGFAPAPFRLPFTVKGVNFGTTTDFLSVDLILEV
jgi:hypothetical protein